jgi:hypothetical protein
MILRELGGWVLIDKHENENSRICMAILDARTAESDFQKGEYRTGRRYRELPPEYKNWKRQDTLPIQQETNMAMNIGINGLATTLQATGGRGRNMAPPMN